MKNRLNFFKVEKEKKKKNPEWSFKSTYYLMFITIYRKKEKTLKNAILRNIVNNKYWFLSQVWYGEKLILFAVNDD